MDAVNPDLTAALQALQQGDLAGAQEHCMRLVRRDDASWDAWHLLGVIHLRRGDGAAAQQALRQALERHQVAGIWVNLGLAQKACGDLAGAEASYAKAIELAPQTAEAYNNLGNLIAPLGRTDEAIAAFRQAIACNPDYGDAHDNLARVLRLSGDLPGAIAGFRRAVQLCPNGVEILLNLANAVRATGQVDEPLQLYARALALAPQRADLHNNLGAMLGLQGQTAQAIGHFEQAAQLDARFLDAHMNLGHAYRVTGKTAQAIASFTTAQNLAPGNGDIPYHLGLLYKSTGDNALAQQSLRRALELRPDNADALNNLGILLKDAGDLPGALDCYQRTLVLQPGNVDAHNNLGVAYKVMGRFDEALACYAKAIELNPSFPEAHSNMGSALAAAGRPKEAVELLRKAATLREKFPEAYNNMGVAYMEMGRPDEAMACFLTSLQHNPDYAEANSNLAVNLVSAGQFDQAFGYYDRAIAALPHFVDAHWNRSLAYLVQGRFDVGWEAYRWRWKRPHAVRQPYPGPEWDGQESLVGKTLVMHHEQGLGDNIQFIRYAHQVQALGGRAVIHVPAEILALCRTIGPQFTVVSRPEDTGEYHFQNTMLCLPRLLGTDLNSIPAPVGYLSADPAKTAQWQDRLRALTGFRVGIVWRGRPEHKNDRMRSLPALQFARMLDVPGLSVVSLQKDPRPEELVALRSVVPGLYDAAPHLQDFSDTAAAMAALDLVLTVDTSAAHVAGAIGVKVWTLIPFSPDWRWLLHRSDSPWYPTMRLWRQQRPGEWGTVIESVRQGLAQGGGNPFTLRADTNPDLTPLRRGLGD